MSYRHIKAYSYTHPQGQRCAIWCYSPEEQRSVVRPLFFVFLKTNIQILIVNVSEDKLKPQLLLLLVFYYYFFFFFKMYDVVSTKLCYSNHSHYFSVFRILLYFIRSTVNLQSSFIIIISFDFVSALIFFSFLSSRLLHKKKYMIAGGILFAAITMVTDDACTTTYKLPSSSFWSESITNREEGKGEEER